MKSGPFLKAATFRPSLFHAAIMPRESVVFPAPPRNAAVTNRGRNPVMVEVYSLGKYSASMRYVVLAEYFPKE